MKQKNINKAVFVFVLLAISFYVLYFLFCNKLLQQLSITFFASPILFIQKTKLMFFHKIINVLAVIYTFSSIWLYDLINIIISETGVQVDSITSIVYYKTILSIAIIYLIFLFDGTVSFKQKLC